MAIVAALLLLLFQSAAGSTVSGRVTDRESGAPLAGFVVTLVGDGKPGMQSVTDADGRYRFEGVVPGRYALAAGPDDHRSTHLRQWFGEPEPSSRYGRARRYPLEIAASTAATADLALARALAIEGRISADEEPLANVSVRVMGTDGIDVLGTSVPSDDRGHYRFYGLPPGRYHVCANAHDGSFRDATSDAAPLVQTCYPQVFSAEAGADVVLVDRDAMGIDISLQRTVPRSISGTVIDESGAPVENASVFAYPSASDTAGGSTHTRGGAFSIRSLLPGTYSLIAFVGVRVRGDAEAPATERQEGYALADVTSVDASGVTVQLRKPSRLSGKLVFDGTRPRTAPRIAVRLYSMDVSLGFIASDAPSSVIDDDLTFALDNVFHAPMVVSLQGLPEGWVLQSVRYGGRDVTFLPTDFASGAGPLEISITDRVAHPLARVTDEAGKVLTDCTVVILPAEPDMWRSGLRTPDNAPTADGTHKLGTLRPGNYLMAGISSADWFTMQRDRRLARVDALGPLATPVTLRAGDTMTIELKLVKVPEKK